MSIIDQRAKAYVRELLDNMTPTVKELILDLHRRQNNNYDGFDSYDDYVKYGDSFVKVEPARNTSPALPAPNEPSDDLP